MSNKTGCLYVVATPIGNLQDMSTRALETLKQVDIIVAEDTRHTGRLLQHYGMRGSLLSLHAYNEEKTSHLLLQYLLDGTHLALVSDAGTPLISDPGYSLVHQCRTAGITVIPIPGPSACISALSVSGLPTNQFFFMGFPPRKVQARRAWLTKRANETATMVFYESSHRILACLHDMVEILGGQRHAVCARELTKLHETILSGPLNTLEEQLNEQVKGEFVVIVAGAKEASTTEHATLDHYLTTLMGDLPLKQAATLAARLLKVNKNQAYKRAIELS